MKIDYRKDLRHNYMVISECEELPAEPYCIHMLEQQGIEGVLSFEQRHMDNQTYYYYEIAGKQSLQSLYDRMVLQYDKVKLLLSDILRILESTYEYLLPEDDYLLTPETVFLEAGTGKPSLCYLPGYGKNRKEQMGSFLEYLMNKVDYNDKEAVLLVYQLYAVSREEGFTLWHLQECLGKPPQTGKKIRSTVMTDQEELVQEEQLPVSLTIPVMMERVESEEEIQAYPLSAYVYTAIGVCIGILVLLAGFAGKLFYNSYGGRPEYGRLFGAVLIILCAEGYLMRRIWDRSNKIARIVTKNEYIDPGLEAAKQSKILPSRRENVDKPANIPKQKKEEEEYNPTCLLNNEARLPDDKKTGLILKSMAEELYPSITVNEFPFFIGKLKKNVDYCIEKEEISRFHAKLTREQESYFITDLNSTNGTFVNGIALQIYTRQEIKVGDELALANLKYQFVQAL